MDCFSLEFLEKFIKHSKMIIVNKLENIELTNEDLPIHSDLLCQVLDFSPKVHHLDRRHVLNMKYCISDHLEEKDSTKLSRGSAKAATLNLERKTSISNEDGENLDPNRPLRKISHCSKIMSSLSEHKRKTSETSVMMIKELLEEILSNVRNGIEINEEKKMREIIKNTNVTMQKKKREKENKFTSSFYQSKENINSNLLDYNASYNISLISKSPSGKNENTQLKVFLIQEPDITTMINITVDNSEEQTLKDLLKQFLEDNRLHPKNINLYYFSEHNRMEHPGPGKQYTYEMTLKEDDISINEINLDIKLKDLIKNNLNELDLLMKKYPDLPDVKFLSYYCGQKNIMSHDERYVTNGCYSFSNKLYNEIPKSNQSVYKEKSENF